MSRDRSGSWSSSTADQNGGTRLHHDDQRVPSSSQPSSSLMPTSVPMQQSSSSPGASTSRLVPVASSSKNLDDAHPSSSPLPTSVSLSDHIPSDPSLRSRANMDRIKSRAVNPGWNWEAEREKQDQSASLRSNSAEPRPQLPTRGSSRLMPRIDTSSTQSLSGMANGNGSAASERRTGISSNVTSPQNYQPPSNNITAEPAKFEATAPIGAAPSSVSTSQPASQSRKRDQTCRACTKPMTGQFVRALGSVYHLDCFRCNDCNKVVAAKFFPATDDMVDSAGTGRLFPLCETDYFRRLDLICAKCNGALRGSYITALGIKFHVEHFTCSVCPTVFGPQDSYYEHDGHVFCHFHYSTRFAIKCTGCKTAILKQFVEINRNNTDEHWHPECYMIHKFWNIKLTPTGSTPKDGALATPPGDTPSQVTEADPTQVAPARNEASPDATEIEAIETPSSLRTKQKQMEERVYRIWTVLSAFEESSAACISEMLRHVSSGRYLGGVRMAEKFILHVEILFSAIDHLEANFRKEQAKGISHIREARMLCKKIVNFFSLLSHTQETGARRMGITQELLSLVTGLAHYLKILIRIALTGALRLDREFDRPEALNWFLSQLAFSAKQGGIGDSDKQAQQPNTSTVGADGKWYGYRSLPRSTSSSSSELGETATDLCVACGQTVEEECLRMGVNLRWHSNCLKCSNCQRQALRDDNVSQTSTELARSSPESLMAAKFGLESSRRSVEGFVPTSSRSTTSGPLVHVCYCANCVEGANVRFGFESVTRLEQYAFLLRVALNRLFALLRKRGVVPASPPTSASPVQGENADDSLATEMAGVSMYEVYRDSQDIKRMKSVNLDRKLSTKAKLPYLSTVVGSPSGRHTQTSDVLKSSPTEPVSLRAGGLTALSKDTMSRDDKAASREPSPSGRTPQRQQTFPTTSQGFDYHRDLLDQSQHFQQHPESQSGLGSAFPSGTELGSIVPIRPAFARHNTDVKIREDGPIRQPSGDDMIKPRPSEDGITLADIPQLLEAEQLREQHRLSPSEGARCISELSALELFIVKHMAVMNLKQSALKDFVNLDDLIEFIETRKNTFWGKIFKGGKDKKEIKKKGVFGIPLEILIERSGADSTLGASAAHLRVPSFIDEVISAMKQMDLSVEGIFRKNGNIRRLKELSETLDRDTTAVNLLDDNPVQLAALLKKFLRELPDPLMTFKLHKLFVMSQKLESEAERRRILHMVTILLPKGHRDTMEVLFAFLKWVASFSHIDEETGSKMDLPNLATVICPNILYSKGSDPTKDETFLANRAVSYILENQDDFWKVPEELEAVLQDKDLMNTSAELTSRDILKRCERIARMRQQRGPVGNVGRGGGPFQAGEMQNRHRPDVHPPTTMRQVQQRELYHNQQRQLGAPPSGVIASNGYSRSPERSGAWSSSAGSLPSSKSYAHSPNERTPTNGFYGSSPQKGHYTAASAYSATAEQRTPTSASSSNFASFQQQQHDAYNGYHYQQQYRPSASHLNNSNNSDGGDHVSPLEQNSH